MQLFFPEFALDATQLSAPGASLPKMFRPPVWRSAIRLGLCANFTSKRFAYLAAAAALFKCCNETACLNGH